MYSDNVCVLHCLTHIMTWHGLGGVERSQNVSATLEHVDWAQQSHKDNVKAYVRHIKAYEDIWHMSVDSCRWWISTKSHRVNITQREVTDVMFFKIYLKEIATVVTRSASIVFHPKSVARVSNMSNTVVIIGFYIDPPMCQNVSNMINMCHTCVKTVKHVLNICQNV